MVAHSGCDRNRLTHLLADRLPKTQLADLHEHLESCADCRSQLESLAAADKIWRDLPRFLATDELDVSQRLAGSAASESSPFQHAGSAAIDTVISELSPASDSSMLGRLGDYEILEVLGSGGMGVVMKGYDRSLNRYVAVKTLWPYLATNAAARKRFAREAKAAAAVVHQHVVAVHAVVGQVKLPYFVMQLVAGQSLQQRIDSEAPMDVKDVLRIGMQAAQGLGAAHGQGLVHRDVKPANILLENDVERVLLTDFGLARAVDDASMTRSGVLTGTPQFMSPEQARGQAIDHRSDLFSLGSVLYTMCTGRPPFRADTSLGVLRRITDEQPTPIRQINPDIPPWLCQVIGRLMSKRPEDRYASAAEVATLLEQCLAHVQQPTAVPLPGGLETPPRTASTRARQWTQALQRLLVVAAVIAFATLTWFGLVHGPSSDPPGISGRWTGEGWGQVQLEQTAAGKYDGTYTDTFGREMGTLQLAWSPIERRYRGTWQEGEHRFGKISVRLVDGQLRGAWTTNRNSKINPGRPRLADLLWVRDDRKSPDHPAGHIGLGPPPTAATPGPSPGFPGPIAAEATALIDAVRAFNQNHANDPIGKEQPPLTDDEVIASIRWAVMDSKTTGIPEIDQFRGIAETRLLPEHWHLDVVKELSGARGERFRAWSIRLLLLRPDGTHYVHMIRQQLLCQVDAEGNPMPLPDVDLRTLPADAKPLAAAINGFNAQHRSLGGQDQPPLTEPEVVAVIRWWKTRRNELDITNGEFAALQAIADQRSVPADANFEVITRFQPGDGFEYLIWSVRFGMRRTVNTSPYPRFGISIRQQYIRSRAIDTGNVCWGQPAENGLQAGVRFEPYSEQYTTGQQVVPQFYFRNTSGKDLETSYPRLMTHSYYEQLSVFDATGKPIPIDQDQGPAGPVGWIRLPLQPGGQYSISGLPILIGDVQRGSAETVIRAQPGQSFRVRFTVPNFADSQAKPLQTGDLPVVVGDAQQRTADQIAR